jgi:hypothetical protein
MGDTERRVLSAGGGALATYLLAKYLLNVKKGSTLAISAGLGGIGGLALGEALASGDSSEAEAYKQKQLDKLVSQMTDTGLIANNPMRTAAVFATSSAVGNIFGNYLLKNLQNISNPRSKNLLMRVFDTIGYGVDPATGKVKHTLGNLIRMGATKALAHPKLSAVALQTLPTVAFGLGGVGLDTLERNYKARKLEGLAIKGGY